MPRVRRYAAQNLVRRLRVSLLCLLPLLLGADRPPGLVDVREIRTWSYADYTRVVVELDQEVELEADPTVPLSANPAAGMPERLYIDLPGVWVGRRYAEGVPVGDGLLQGVRLRQNTRTLSRLVVDLDRYDRHRFFTLRSPDRLVLDVYGEPQKKRALAPPANKSDPQSKSRLSMATRRLSTVVIDPGHGGRDPGAVGIGGIHEKDVNLKLALLLKKRLEARAFAVVLTREDDRYLDLEERTAIAESAKGDVFISIHSNASDNRKLRGIEVYYLDQDDDRHNVEVAARENGVTPGQVDQMQKTLARLRVAEASRHSRDLATYVHGDLTRGLAQNYSNVSDLGIKTGPFYVLFMSSMPSILVEAGFLTNPKDAKRLSDDRYLDVMAAQIAAGLGHYRNRAPKRAARSEALSGEGGL